jgi:hypothetical protein
LSYMAELPLLLISYLPMLHNNQPVQVYDLLMDLSTKKGALGTQWALNLSLRLNQCMAGTWFGGLEPQVPVLVSKLNQN